MAKKISQTEQDYLRSAIASISEPYKFHEVYGLKESTNDDEEILIRTIRKGLFIHEDKTLTIACKFVNPRKLKPPLDRAFTNRFDVEKIYEGEKYLLCIKDSKIYCYDIKKYNLLNSLIDEVDNEFQINEKKITIGYDEKSKVHILFIETKIADFGIAGQRSAKQEEIERVILSNKLAASQPFFKFKAPINFDWSKLIGDEDRQFERICELLLQKDPNVTKIIPIGKTRAADRGRDFEVIELHEGFNKKPKTKWLVQCKFSKHSISPASVSGWTDRIIEHKYDGFWLMTNNDITPNLFDQFKDVEANDKFDIKTRYWQRSDFYIKLNVHSELFINNDIFKLE